MSCYEYGKNAMIINNGSKEKMPCWGGFNKIKQGKSSAIQRRTDNLSDYVAPNTTITNRDKLQTRFSNNRINRLNFYKPNPVKINLNNLETLRTKDISEEGVKINLSDATLDKLFRVEIPDIMDKEWLLEKQRRIANGETEQDIIDRPPLSRKQKTTFKMTNLGETQLTFRQKIEQLNSVLKQNALTRQGNMKQIVVDLTTMMTNVNQLTKATSFELDVIKKMLDRLYVPRDWRQQFKNQVVNGDEYREDMGAINMFLMSNIPSDLSASKPIKFFDGRKNDYVPAPLSKLMTLKAEKKYLDLEARTIDTKDILMMKGLWTSVEQDKEDAEQRLLLSSTSTIPPPLPTTPPPMSMD